MIRYRRRTIPPFLEEYLNLVHLYEAKGKQFITFGEWLKPFGASYDIENDFTVAAMDVITFENPEDELAFRLRWAI